MELCCLCPRPSKFDGFGQTLEALVAEEWSPAKLSGSASSVIRQPLIGCHSGDRRGRTELRRPERRTGETKNVPPNSPTTGRTPHRSRTLLPFSSANSNTPAGPKVATVRNYGAASGFLRRIDSRFFHRSVRNPRRFPVLFGRSSLRQPGGGLRRNVQQHGAPSSSQFIGVILLPYRISCVA